MSRALCTESVHTSMVCAGNDKGQNEKHTGEKKRHSKVYKTGRYIIHQGKGNHAKALVYRLYTFYPPTHDGKKTPYDAVDPDNADNNQSSRSRHKLLAAKSSQSVFKAHETIHTDGQKSKNGGGHSDEVGGDKCYAHYLSMSPKALKKKKLYLERHCKSCCEKIRDSQG